MNKATKIFNHMMEKDYFSQWLEIEAVELEEGFCQTKMMVRKEMLNGFGILHGGIAFALADSTLAFAANSYGKLAVSINGSINYFASAKVGDTLLATATPEKVGKTVAHFMVEIVEEQSERKICSARGTVLRKEKAF